MKPPQDSTSVDSTSVVPGAASSSAGDGGVRSTSVKRESQPGVADDHAVTTKVGPKLLSFNQTNFGNKVNKIVIVEKIQFSLVKNIWPS